jgi:CubicO group peptidase (beta-lactamase class C family)
MKSPAFLAAFALSSLTAMSADTDYTSAIPLLEAAVEREIKAYGIGGIAVALTDGQRLVHAAGYGEAQRDSVFRAGSVSKLFNAVSVMQQVEAGKLSLDAPFASLPGAVLPVNPFPEAPAITLRQMLCHRSGIQREAPVGGYLDDSQPTQKATCESVRGCVVVTPPNAKTRYSNIVPTLAGEVVATGSGKSFEKYQAEHLFAPLGMTRSAWLVKDVPGGKVLTSHWRVADGKGGFTREETPLFDLGTVPAGNLFTTAPDLAQFVMMLDAKGAGKAGRVLKEETLAEMWKPQLVPDGAFGLGFALGKFREHPSVGHNGAVFGHSTALSYLPGTRLGVVVIGNEDIVNARIGKLANLALSLMLERKTGEKPPAPPVPVQLSDKELEVYAGPYESRSFWCELSVKNGRLEGNYASQPCVMVPTGKDTFILNSRIHDDVPIKFTVTGGSAQFSAGVQMFTRGGLKRPGIPAEWRRFVGSYGPKFIPIVVHEKFGHLYATTENMVDYRMTPVNRHTFLLPPGMYDDEHAVFLTNADGTVHSLNFCNMILPRLP